MKTYEDYEKDYERIVSEGVAKGDNMVVKRDVYIAIHFFEDNGIVEPWADDAPYKLKNALDKYSPTDQNRFMSAISTTLETFTKGE